MNWGSLGLQLLNESNGSALFCNGIWELPKEGRLEKQGVNLARGTERECSKTDKNYFRNDFLHIPFYKGNNHPVGV